MHAPVLLQAYHDLGTANFSQSVKASYYYLDSIVGFDENLKMTVAAAPKSPLSQAMT